MEAALTDYYATLGLDRNCTTAQIRSAYRLLVKRHHPDRNPDSAEALERSQELNAAHQILSDPARRRSYDRELEESAASNRPQRAGRIQRNVSEDVKLCLADFFRGTSLEVRINDPANSAGAETYELVIPPNTSPGARFRIPRGAPFQSGFVSVRLRALPDFRFKIRGSDLQCDLRINSRRAAEGGSEMVTGPLGTRLTLTIPARVRRGELLRIPGEGLPKPRGGRGDLLIRVIYRPEVHITRRDTR